MAKPSSRGKFITFEGLDGCGKTTQLEKLAAELRGHGTDVVTTREPGGTEIGERIRAVLLDSRTAGLDAHAEMALMFASRAQQIAEVILPALEAGQWVLCDRFTDSTEAYQGGGRKLGSAAVLQCHEALCGGLWPDLTILMDTDVTAGVARARRRNKAAVISAPSFGTNAAQDGVQPNENRFEQESRAFFTRVRNAYLEIARRESQRVALVDARPPLDVVHPEIVRIVRERLRIA
jgi:dTMP kinase